MCTLYFFGKTIKPINKSGSALLVIEPSMGWQPLDGTISFATNQHPTPRSVDFPGCHFASGYTSCDPLQCRQTRRVTKPYEWIVRIMSLYPPSGYHPHHVAGGTPPYKYRSMSTQPTAGLACTSNSLNVQPVRNLYGYRVRPSLIHLFFLAPSGPTSMSWHGHRP